MKRIPEESKTAGFTCFTEFRVFPYLVLFAFLFSIFESCTTPDTENRKNDASSSQGPNPASAGTFGGSEAAGASGQSTTEGYPSVSGTNRGVFDASSVDSGGQLGQRVATGGAFDSGGHRPEGGVSGSFGQSGTTGGTLSTGSTASPYYPGGFGSGVDTEENSSRLPFGCDFAWGTNDPGGSLVSLDYLDFVTKWVGYEVDSNGAISQCDGCWWLSNQVSTTQLIPVFYAYFIGFFGKANGLPDGNEAPNAPNLTTHASALIISHRSQIIEMYSQYAQQAYQVWSDRPLVWLLEGDLIQYTEDIQTDPLSMSELGLLTAEITSAIKSNMPNAVVAINHTTWNSNEETDAFWQSMQDASVAYDMVWTTGVANNNGYIEAFGNANYYNAATARYEYIHRLTGRNIFVDTSFGISAMADTWTTVDATTLNVRIDEGVIAANVVTVPEDYPRRIVALDPLLNSPCD